MGSSCPARWLSIDFYHGGESDDRGITQALALGALTVIGQGRQGTEGLTATQGCNGLYGPYSSTRCSTSVWASSSVSSAPFPLMRSTVASHSASVLVAASTLSRV